MMVKQTRHTGSTWNLEVTKHGPNKPGQTKGEDKDKQRSTKAGQHSRKGKEEKAKIAANKKEDL